MSIEEWCVVIVNDGTATSVIIEKSCCVCVCVGISATDVIDIEEWARIVDVIIRITSICEEHASVVIR